MPDKLQSYIDERWVEPRTLQIAYPAAGEELFDIKSLCGYEARQQ